MLFKVLVQYCRDVFLRYALRERVLSKQGGRERKSDTAGMSLLSPQEEKITGYTSTRSVRPSACALCEKSDYVAQLGTPPHKKKKSWQLACPDQLGPSTHQKSTDRYALADAVIRMFNKY